MFEILMSELMITLLMGGIALSAMFRVAYEALYLDRE